MWQPFAAGCKAVRVGLVIELAAVVGVLAVLGYPVARAVVLGRVIGEPVLSGPRQWLPFAAILFLGALVTAFGRLRMTALPAGTGARGALVVAAGLTATRVLALGFVVAAFLWTAGDLPTGHWWRASRALNSWAMGAALTAGMLADVAAILGISLVAGAVPDHRLRRTAGRVAGVVLLLAALLWPVGLYALYLLRMRQLHGTRASLPWHHLDLDPGWVMVLIVLAAIGLLVWEVAYTWMQYRLYSAARAAVRLTPNPGHP